MSPEDVLAVLPGSAQKEPATVVAEVPAVMTHLSSLVSTPVVPPVEDLNTPLLS